MSGRICLVLFALTLLTVAALAQESRDGNGNVVVSLNGGDNVAYIGETNTVEIWIENDALVQGLNLGFEFAIQVDFDFSANHGGSGHYVQEHGRAVAAFDMLTGLLETAFMDGTDPDSILFGGSAFPGHGLPAGPLELCYTLLFSIPPDQDEVAGGVSIDNAFIPPSGGWTFWDPSGTYAPLYQGHGNSSEDNPDAPAVEFDVVVRENTPPELTNCPTETISISHGEFFVYQFEVYDPDPGEELYWTIVEGPGAIDGLGNYQFDPENPDFHTVVIRVEDHVGEFDECSFELEVTNTAPVVTNCPVDQAINHCETFFYHFEAADEDPGDELTWEVIGGFGNINSVTGDFVFDPSAHGAGVYQIEVMVTDSFGENETCTFALDAVNNPPEITNSCLDTVFCVPLSTVEYVFAGYDPDPCDPLTYSVTAEGSVPVGEYYMVGDAFYFEPLYDDIGVTYEFTVTVDDGWDQIACTLFAGVLYGDDCEHPIEIDSLPFIYTGSLAPYQNLLQPTGDQCGGVEPGFGDGPEVVFSYYSVEAETLLVTLIPIGSWNLGGYFLEGCDLDNCLGATDEGGDNEAETLPIEELAGAAIKFIVDQVNNAPGNLKRFAVIVQKAADPKCASIDMSALTTTIVAQVGVAPPPVSLGNGPRVIASAHIVPEKTPDEECDVGYQIESPNLLRASVVLYHFREAAKPGRAMIEVKIEGNYTVIPDPAGHPLGVTCVLNEGPVRGGYAFLYDRDQDAKTYLHYTRQIQPFHPFEVLFTPEGTIGGWFPPSRPGIHLFSARDFDPISSYVPFNQPQYFTLKPKVDASAGPFTRATARILQLGFKITCPCREEKSAAGEPVLKEYPVEIEITGKKLTRQAPVLAQPLSIADEFSAVYEYLDSGFFQNGGLAAAESRSFEPGIWFTNRTNALLNVDTATELEEYPCDSSAVFYCSGSEVEEFSLVEPLMAPSAIAFDEYGHFGDVLLVAQAADFDEMGAPLLGSGMITAIDDLGSSQTLASGLTAPVALAVADGGVFGNDLYITDIASGEVIMVSPGGAVATFAGGMNAPIDLAFGTGGFGDYLYVVDYDTTFTDAESDPNSGRLYRFDVGGQIDVFVDGLQAPTALAFGPGGPFGTDLYIALDNELVDSAATLPQTAKIVTVDPGGAVTEFASGLDSPSYLCFGPDGHLYATVAGGIMKFAPYICGDANADELVNITDAVYLIQYIFSGGAEPNPYMSGDANCDEIVNITDAVYLIQYIFSGGYTPCDPSGDGVPDC